MKLNHVPWRDSWKYGNNSYQRQLGSWELHFKECAVCRKEWATKRELVPYTEQINEIEKMALKNHPER